MSTYMSKKNKSNKNKNKIESNDVVTKNQTYEMVIDDIGSNGEGIGRIEGFTVFVEGALPDEKIKVLILKIKKSFAFGKIVEILEKSKHRVEPICKVAKHCGGCQLQHLSYEGQLQYKLKKTNEALKRIGKVENINITTMSGMDSNNFTHYRNKAQFPVGKNNITSEVEIGFYAKRSHRIIDNDCCLIQHEKNTDIIKTIRGFLNENKISIYDEIKHKGLFRHIVTRVSKSTGEMMIILVLNGYELPEYKTLIESLRAFPFVTSIILNVNKSQTNVILGRKTEVLWGKEFIEDTIDDIVFEISPLSFYQVNPVQTEVLYKKALEFSGVTSDDTVLDLYCGIGTISLIFAKHAKKVFGIEIVPDAIKDARKNAKNNNIENIQFYTGAVEEILENSIMQKDYYKESGFDIVILDPPRKGAEPSVLQSIKEISPEKIVYVSCNPATLARDIEILIDYGFKVDKAEVVDEFPLTVHVESVVLLTKK